jgi:hydroxymethylpyrimidine/phosphomethylpyrimidine kinase
MYVFIAGSSPLAVILAIFEDLILADRSMGLAGREKGLCLLQCCMPRTSTVLCIGGHDPTGGAGLQADIETLAAHQVRACTLVTCLTAQDTHDVHAIWPTPEGTFRRQRDVLLNDIQPDAVKVGLLGSVGVATATLELLQTIDVPVVIDPVLAAGGGAELSSRDLIDVLRKEFLPTSQLLTPNRRELVRLAGVDAEAEAATELLSLGGKALLVTGADAATASGDDLVINTLYTANAAPRTWNWMRLPGVYHGSGCTLASACAAALAKGVALENAVDQAQRYTWEALEKADGVGSAQQLPTRFK